MNFEQRCITKEELSQIWVLEESHFVDFKSKDISPRKLSRTILHLRMQVVAIYI